MIELAFFVVLVLIALILFTGGLPAPVGGWILVGLAVAAWLLLF